MTQWHAVHIHYHDDPDPLIIGGIRPLFQRLAGVVTGMYYTRHWRLGPHLRLRFRCTERAFARAVRPAVEDVIGGFLAARPSTSELDPDSFLTAHQRLADLEQEPGALVPWHPDNSFHVADQTPRVEVHGGLAMADLLDDFYSDTTELALQTTQRVPRGSARLALGFDLMVAVAHALSGVGITGGCLSYRSHAEAFLCTFPEGTGLRPAWDDHYRLHSSALLARLRNVTAGLGNGGAAESPITAWVEVLNDYQGRATRLMDQGLFAMPQGDARSELDLARRSPLHQAGFANPRWLEVRESAGFLLYRLMINYTYLHLSRLGVAPVERFQLCHLAASAVEDLHGVSALSMMTYGVNAPLPETR
ncbi:thiopeptide maturation pyridine synthase [Actinokineospora cianjurensis]|uniref:Lantibiotic biosynthesis dehydratase-like protein n=1 Tax=Actinokineospora cianjurensis TaxID=585224 RepID=A0A421B5E0_9PSEU|nr:thiopeptide maturation pyridine synthase [Actinokineospora cianjurensis]RLK59480.1 lantibiotic biosynthesis dehydratase-like protein [Actinokineospora cianjurensis]